MRLRDYSLRLLPGLLPVCVGASISFGAAAGKPNLSGNLSKVAQPLKNQKLLADPEGAIEGSTSITYDTSVAMLTQILAEPEGTRAQGEDGYYLDKVIVNGFAANGTTPDNVTTIFDSGSTDSNLQGLTWVPTPAQLPVVPSGAIQVFWSDLPPDGSGNLPNLDDSTIRAAAIAGVPDTTGGINAVGDNNTYAAFFGPTTNDPNALAQYLVYADPGVSDGGNFQTPDEYTALLDPSNGTTVTYTAGEITPASAQGTFSPEPSSLTIIGVGAVMMLRRRRSR